MSVFGSARTNSSPPQRHPASTARSDSRITRAVRTSTLSPTGCPSRSLMDLKPFRSMRTTERMPSERSAREISRREVVEEEAAVVEARQRIRDRVDAQDREVRLGDEARLLQQALLAVEVMEQHGLEAERRARASRAALGIRRSISLQRVERLVGLEGDPGPVREQLPQDFAALAVAGDRVQGLAEARQREVALAPEPREAADPRAQVFGHPHSPPVLRPAPRPAPRELDASSRGAAPPGGPLARLRGRAGRRRRPPRPRRLRGNRPGRAVRL